MSEFAMLGMLVACSLFVAIGWLDRSGKSFLKQVLGWAKRKRE
jgi:hypothetical protein